MPKMTDDELRALWRKHGGDFHGPNIETGTMLESKLLPFLRSLLELPNHTIKVEPHRAEFGGGFAGYPKKAITQAQNLASTLYQMLPAEERAAVDARHADVAGESKNG